MKNSHDLTAGPILSALARLTLPIIAINFMSTTYGLVDMFWIGRLGSDPVAAVGTAGFYINLASALLTIVSIGTGVKVAHSMGQSHEGNARVYFRNGLLLALGLGVVYLLFIVAGKQVLIGFFGLHPDVERMAAQYLVISICGIVFAYVNTLFSAVLTARGNSKVPFRAQSAGFLVNMLLDPLLIFGVGRFHGLGIAGAALATIIAHALVTGLFVGYIRRERLLAGPYKFDGQRVLEVMRLGGPITVQRVAFIVISILMAKLIARWGAEAIAVQRVGIQIESISYMTIGGLQGAIAAFIGQNFGAKQTGRIKQGYRNALLLTSLFGMGVSLLFVLFPKPLFAIFLADETSLSLGIDYMRIIGVSQLFMCLELMTVGAFNGIGKTHIPPAISISLTALRIPAALLLMEPFGLNGAWLAIAGSSVLKGIVLVGLFLRTMRKGMLAPNRN